MWKKIGLLLPLLATSLLPARDKAETWIEVTSPHFIVASNGNEKQARRVAGQFERMRSVFLVLFPRLHIDPGSPVIVLAIRDEKDFRALEPAVYLAKGQLKLGGLFLRAPDKNYVLMRLDAEGEHPYAVVYHEYTHLLLSKAAEWLPLWLNEGLAEFYQNTDIHEKEVELGQPSPENIRLLRENRLLPLATLFAVDRNSPYYHEENKGSIFYAESWALTHYLHIKDYQQKTHRLSDYGELLAKKVAPLEAARTAFGDLQQLEAALDDYVQERRFNYEFTMKTPTAVDDSAFPAKVLTSPQSDALRADFLAYNQRENDARALLDRVLAEEPNNVSAHETMGFLAFQHRHIDEAKKWYAQAVALDSQSYLAYYYFSAIAMQGALTPAEEAQVEASLQRASQLNPSFAPTFDRLAVFWGMRHKNLEEARMAGLTAITLDPGNVGYRVNEANVLVAMEQGDRAVQVLEAAAKLAKTPEEVEWVEHALSQARDYAAVQQRAREEEKRLDAPGTASPQPSSGGTEAAVPHLAHRAFVPRGPHRFLTGVLKDVHCDSSHLDLALHVGAKTLALHSDDYYKIQFSVLGFKPTGDLKPCTDLEGRPAKIEYVESADGSESAHLVAIELHK
jgi:tetratricopeptide (TPR) repeat protein